MISNKCNNFSVDVGIPRQRAKKYYVVINATIWTLAAHGVGIYSAADHH